MFGRMIGSAMVVAALGGCGGQSEHDGQSPATSGGASASGGAAGSGVTAGTSGAAGTTPSDAELDAPALRVPENGRATGSVWAERARTPRFTWGAVPGAATYEFELDDSCPVTDFRSCDFPSPERVETDLAVPEVALGEALAVSLAPPVGRRYFWRVRACGRERCSVWSAPRYLDVGRQPNDFDGDGYGDVLVPMPRLLGELGSVAVRFGPDFARTAALADPALPVDTADPFAGLPEAAGDVDADGFADLVVGSSGNPAEERGRAFVVFGRSDFSAAAVADAWRIDGRTVGEAFGFPARGVGDVDGDGRKDVAIGFSTFDSPVRPALLFRGAPRDALPEPREFGMAGLGESGNSTFSAGDADGDGYSDLLVARVEFGDAATTTFELWPGSESGVAAGFELGNEAGHPGDVEIVGDVTGDGFADLVRSVTDQSALPEAHVAVTFGTRLPSLEPSLTWRGGLSARDPEFPGRYVELRNAVNVGDLNGDGVDDSAVGVDWHDSGLIQANVYLGGQGSRERPDAVYALDSGVLLYVAQGIPKGIGDVNGDGFGDLLLNDGYVYFGGPELDTVADVELHGE